MFVYCVWGVCESLTAVKNGAGRWAVRNNVFLRIQYPDIDAGKRIRLVLNFFAQGRVIIWMELQNGAHFSDFSR